MWDDQHGTPCPRRPKAQIEGNVNETTREAYMCISPRKEDPPPSVRISSWKRGEGEFKYHLSPQAEKLARAGNEPLYRYERKAVDEQIKNATPPVSPRQLRDPREKMPWGSDLQTEKGAESPRVRSHVDNPTFRYGRANDSNSFSRTMNSKLVNDEFSAERKARLASERAFADVCEHTEVAQQQKQQERRSRSASPRGVRSAVIGDDASLPATPRGTTRMRGEGCQVRNASPGAATALRWD